MHNILTDCRTWFYYPIEMPITKEGFGPASYDECHSIMYEVWDRELNSVSSHRNLPDAINEAIRRNQEIGWNVTFEKISKFIENSLDK